DQADFCKALIHLAAAGVKAREGRERGVIDHAQRAETLLGELQARGNQALGGLALEGLARHARDVAEKPDWPKAEEPPPPVLIVVFALATQNHRRANDLPHLRLEAHPLPRPEESSIVGFLPASCNFLGEIKLRQMLKTRAGIKLIKDPMPAWLQPVVGNVHQW